MVDLNYIHCVNDKDLKEITKTEVKGLHKLKYLIFLCLTFTNPLRRKRMGHNKGSEAYN